MLSSSSPILHTFTNLSIEPVAIQGKVGDSATVVTYLQEGARGTGMWKVCVCVIDWNWHRKRAALKIWFPRHLRKEKTPQKTSLRSCSILNSFKDIKAVCCFLPVVPHQWRCKSSAGEYTFAPLHPVLLGKANQAKITLFDLKHQDSYSAVCLIAAEIALRWEVRPGHLPVMLFQSLEHGSQALYTKSKHTKRECLTSVFMDAVIYCLEVLDHS